MLLVQRALHGCCGCGAPLPAAMALRALQPARVGSSARQPLLPTLPAPLPVCRLSTASVLCCVTVPAPLLHCSLALLLHCSPAAAPDLCSL